MEKRDQRERNLQEALPRVATHIVARLYLQSSNRQAGRICGPAASNFHADGSEVILGLARPQMFCHQVRCIGHARDLVQLHLGTSEVVL